MAGSVEFRISSAANSSTPSAAPPCRSSTRAPARSTPPRPSPTKPTSTTPTPRRRRPSRTGSARRRPTVRRRCSISPTRWRKTPQALVEAEGRNTGKPNHVTAAEEIPPMLDQIRFFAGAARVLEGKSAGEYMENHTSWIRREPVGVIGQVAPWNYPMMMAIWKFCPAIAAGNTVVIKPSDTTPVTTVMLAEMAAKHFPPGVLNVVCGDRNTGASGGRASDAGDGVDHRFGGSGPRGGGERGRTFEAHPLGIGRQGTGDRVRRQRHRQRRRGNRDGGILQRRPGLHGGHPSAGDCQGGLGSDRCARRAGARRDDDVRQGRRRRGRVGAAGQQRQPDGAGAVVLHRCAVARQGGCGWRPPGRQGFLRGSRPSWAGCGRTTAWCSRRSSAR